MDRETAICLLIAIVIAVAVTIWSITTGDWMRAEAAMFDGYSPEARRHFAHARDAHATWHRRPGDGRGGAVAVPQSPGRGGGHEGGADDR